MDDDVFWSLDSDTEPVAPNFQNRDFDIISNENLFISFSSDDEHRASFKGAFMPPKKYTRPGLLCMWWSQPTTSECQNRSTGFPLCGTLCCPHPGGRSREAAASGLYSQQRRFARLLCLRRRLSLGKQRVPSIQGALREYGLKAGPRVFGFAFLKVSHHAEPPEPGLIHPLTEITDARTARTISLCRR